MSWEEVVDAPQGHIREHTGFFQNPRARKALNTHFFIILNLFIIVQEMHPLCEKSRQLGEKVSRI